jgi:hypothetical protein
MNIFQKELRIKSDTVNMIDNKKEREIISIDINKYFKLKIL